MTDPIVKSIVHASINAARSFAEEATCEEDLRIAARKAAIMMVRFGTSNRHPSEPEAFMDAAGALGAYLFLESFATGFPNVEAVLKRIDEGEVIINQMMKET